jgi:ABC-type dipeptide/oligopeptide/nickel transport system ATPase subunit
MLNLLGQKVTPPLRESVASFNDIIMVFQNGYNVINAIRSKKDVLTE